MGIKRKHGPSPKPLGSLQHPDGLPGLSDRDKARVDTANILCRLSCEILAYATREGSLCSLENPKRSHMWQTSFLKNALSSVQHYLHEVFFHHCMFGSKRAKRTKLLVNHSCFDRLNRECDQGHPHEKWGHTQSGWATALEVEYPLQLCREYAACLRSTLLAHGALAPPTEMMQDDSLNLNLAAKASLGIPVRGKRLRPLMREHSHVLHISGPKSFIYQFTAQNPRNSRGPPCNLQGLPKCPGHPGSC